MTNRELYIQLAQTCEGKVFDLDLEMKKYGDKLMKCAYDAAQWKLKEAEFKAKALEESL